MCRDGHPVQPVKTGTGKNRSSSTGTAQISRISGSTGCPSLTRVLVRARQFVNVKMYSSSFEDQLPNNFVASIDGPFCSWNYARNAGKYSQLLLGIYYIYIVVHMSRYLLLDKNFGPLIVAVAKMIQLVAKFFVIFIIGIFSYGVVQDRSYV